MSASEVAWLRRRKIDSLHYIASASNDSDQHLYDVAMRLQLAAMETVLEELEGAGVPATVLKGADAATRYHSGRGLNLLADVDVLVVRSHIERSRSVLRDLGYVQGVLTGTGEIRSADEEQIRRVEQDHYELYPFVKVESESLRAASGAECPAWPCFEDDDGMIRLVVSVDVHHGIARNIPGDDLCKRAVRRGHGHGLHLSNADLIWTILSRFYVDVGLDGKRSLRDFIYVVPALREPDVDWDVVMRANATHRLGAVLFYFLAFLNDLLQGVVPPEVLSECSPVHTRRRQDWGWQLGKLFDFVDPLPPALARSKGQEAAWPG